MASHSSSLPFTLAVWFLVSLTSVVAQSCWRDTKCTGPQTAAFPGEWESNLFAPPSRTVTPKAVFDLGTGETSDIKAVSFATTKSGVYYDFGFEVGGIATIQFTVTSVDGDGALGIAFTEAKNWIGPISDSSNGNTARKDGAIYANFSSTGDQTYVMPDELLRGGFRYMTIFLTGATSSVTINDVSVELSFQPTWSNLQAYQGYFHSSDDMLNKIWYSGAYVSPNEDFLNTPYSRG